MPIPLSYDHRNKSRTQNLRREMTRQERKLWYDFLKSYPVQFRRQKQFGYYIVDFYCADAKLVVEVDGGQHFSPEEIVYDQRRTSYMESLGLHVIRFTNIEIEQRFYQVCTEINRVIQQE